MQKPLCFLRGYALSAGCAALHAGLGRLHCCTQQLCFLVEYVSLSVDMVLHDERCYAGLCATKTLQLVNNDVLCRLKGLAVRWQ
jgi:hypothetical protein